MIYNIKLLFFILMACFTLLFNCQKSVSIEKEFVNKSMLFNISLQKIDSVEFNFTDEYPLQQIQSFDINKKGEFYIVDGKNPTIFIYNKEGNIITSFGEYGQGPRDFLLPLHLQFNKNDNLIVWDKSFKISCLDKNNEFKFSFNIGTCYQQFSYIHKKNENYLLPVKKMTKDQFSPFVIGEFTKEGQFIKSFGEMDPVYYNYNLHDFSRVKVSQNLVNKKIAYVQEASYKINILNPQTEEIFWFGVKGNENRKIKGFSDQVPVDFNEYCTLVCENLSIYTTPVVINDGEYIIVQYCNYNQYKIDGVFGSANYTNNKKNYMDGYIQVYNLKNQEYIGEVHIKNCELMKSKNGYLYFKLVDGSAKNIIYKYSISIIKKGS